MTTIWWATLTGYFGRTILGVAGDPSSDRKIRQAKEGGRTIEWFSRADDQAWDGSQLDARERRQVERALENRTMEEQQ